MDLTYWFNLQKTKTKLHVMKQKHVDLKEVKHNTTNLVTKDQVIFKTTAKDQIECNIDHADIGTQCLTSAKDTARQPITNSHHLHKTQREHTDCNLKLI